MGKDPGIAELSLLSGSAKAVTNVLAELCSHLEDQAEFNLLVRSRRLLVELMSLLPYN